MSQADVRVRDAVPTDLPQLVGFACLMAWETEHKRLDAEVVGRGIGAMFEQPARGRYFVAERDGEVVGTLMLTYEWSDWRAGDWWWIQSVYVVEAARRGGVFSALYRHVREAAAARGDVCGLRLYVEHDNRQALATYGALGMQDAGYRMLEDALPWVAGVVRSG